MSTETSFRAALLAGARDTAPLLPGAGAIGLITGVAAVAVGLDPVQAVAMSAVVNSPLVVLTAFHLLDVASPLVVVVLASLVVGVRFAVLSLSIAPYFERLSTRRKWALSYFLLTPVYALSVRRYTAVPETDRTGYYLGVAVPGWITVQATFLVGLRFGGSVPASWHVGFVLPLAFIALVIRFLADRAARVAALVAGVLAVVGAGLPLETGLVVAVLGGVAAASVVSRRGGT